MDLTTALRPITSNVADALQLKGYGHIAKDQCANLCVMDDDLTLTMVVSRGKVMMRDKTVLVKGTFED